MRVVAHGLSQSLESIFHIRRTLDRVDLLEYRIECRQKDRMPIGEVPVERGVRDTHAFGYPHGGSPLDPVFGDDFQSDIDDLSLPVFSFESTPGCGQGSDALLVESAGTSSRMIAPPESNDNRLSCRGGPSVAAGVVRGKRCAGSAIDSDMQ